jgi:hypothetical protein
MGDERAAGRPVPLTMGRPSANLIPCQSTTTAAPVAAPSSSSSSGATRRSAVPTARVPILNVSSHFRHAPLPAAASRTTVASGHRPAVAAAEVAANRTRVNPAACPPPSES